MSGRNTNNPECLLTGIRNQESKQGLKARHSDVGLRHPNIRVSSCLPDFKDYFGRAFGAAGKMPPVMLTSHIGSTFNSSASSTVSAYKSYRL